MISHVLIVTRPAALVATLLLAGCEGSPPGPYLGAAQSDGTPVILIPGIEATSLVEADSGRPVWSANPRLLLDSSSFGLLALPVSPQDREEERAPLVPGGIIRGLLATDYYGSLIDALEREHGPCVLPEELDADTSCVLQSWDWRLGIPEAAARLERTVERLRALRGDPGLRVDLVTHSAGGLVARYFVRFAGRDVLSLPPSEVRVDLAGADKVRKAILIGVPNEGSTIAARVMMRGHRVGIAQLDAEVVATMTGIYQAMPHPDLVWLMDRQGVPLKRDLYDLATWRGLRGSVFHPDVAQRVRDSPGGEARLAALEEHVARALEQARRFHLALAKPAERSFSYSVVAGDCRPTPSRFVEEEDRDGFSHLRAEPEEIESPAPGIDYPGLMGAPGDGWVTRASALGQETGEASFEVANAIFSCTKHSLLAADPLIRHNLLGQLRWQVGEPSLAAAGGARVERPRLLVQAPDGASYATPQP